MLKPRQQKRRMNLGLSSSVKFMNRPQEAAKNLNLFLCPFQSFTHPLTPLQDFVLLPSFSPSYKPSIVWNNLWGLSGILLSGNLIYKTACTVLTGCNILQCLHVLLVTSFSWRSMTHFFLIISANVGYESLTRWTWAVISWCMLNSPNWTI